MTTIRVWFTKTGEAAYISLLDLQRVMQRALKRSQLPVWYSKGFNPHIYLTFAAPLSLMQESLVESFDFKTEDDALDCEHAKQALDACLPKGISVVRIEPVQMDPKSIAFARYEVRYSATYAQKAQEAFHAFATAEKAIILKKTKKGKMKEVDLKENSTLESCAMQDDGTFMATLLLPTGSVLNVNPALILGYLETEQGLPVFAGNILRVALLTKTQENFA